MTKDEALKLVATKLAWNSYDAIKAVEKTPTLKYNTREILDQNIEVARALSIEDRYGIMLKVLVPVLPPEIKKRNNV